MITLDKPLHLHDCDASHCTYLGTVMGSDVYTYDNGGRGFVIRHSSDGPDYYSSALDGPPHTDQPRALAAWQMVMRHVHPIGDEPVRLAWHPVWAQSTLHRQADALVATYEMGDRALPIFLDGITLIIDERTGDTLARIDYRQ